MTAISEEIRFLFFERKDKEAAEEVLNVYNSILIASEKIVRMRPYNIFDISKYVNKYGTELFLVVQPNEAGTGVTTANIPGIGIKPCIIIDASDPLYILKKPKTLKEILETFKSYIIHEIQHIIDTKRLKKTIVVNKNNSSNYYNDPQEFNAYFIQFYENFTSAYNILISENKNRNKIDVFYDYFGVTPHIFERNFWIVVNKFNNQLYKHLNEKYKFKWQKRIYQLYKDLEARALS